MSEERDPEAPGEVASEDVPESLRPEGEQSELGSAPGKRPGPLRRLYDWVLHWAFTPYGAWALFILAFAESSFFPVPPDPLLMALCLGAPAKSLRFAGIATLASVVGGIAGYAIGAGIWGAADTFFFTYVPGVSPESFERVRLLYEQYDFWAVFAAGLSPIPYKVFTISSGVFGINLLIFAVASLLSRGLRFFLVAGLIYRYGKPVSRFIDRYFDLLSFLFVVLLVGGFLVIEFLL